MQCPLEEEQDKVYSDKEVEHNPLCRRCAGLKKVCIGLPNWMCNICQKLKEKCDKLSRHGGGHGGGDEKAKTAGV